MHLQTIKVLDLQSILLLLESNGWGGGIRTHISRVRAVLPAVLETDFLPLEYSPISEQDTHKKLFTALCPAELPHHMAMGVGLEPTTSGLTGLIFYNLIAESVFFILHIYYNIFFYKSQFLSFFLCSAIYRFKNLQPLQPFRFLHFQQLSVSNPKYRGGCGRIFLIFLLITNDDNFDEELEFQASQIHHSP